MKTLLYNVNQFLAFELRGLGDFDILVKDGSFWNHNVRPKPENIREVIEIDESAYNCVVSENFTGFEYNVRKVNALKIPFLSSEHYAYVPKLNAEFISGGNFPFQSEDEMRMFVKVATNQKVSFLGPNIGICKNIEIPGVQQLSNLGDLHRASVRRYYNYLQGLGSHLGYLNVIKNNRNVYEAMMLGSPVVSVKMDDDFKHGVCGLFSDDPYELRSYLAYLIENPQVALKMGANAKRYIENRFSKSHFRKGWEKVLA